MDKIVIKATITTAFIGAMCDMPILAQRIFIK